MTVKCPKSVAKALYSSFLAGEIPSKGLGTIAVGRRAEIESVDFDLDALEDGIGSFRFIVGRYGTGKSFMAALIREHAMNRGMAVMSASLTESALFSGSKKGLNLYRNLIAGMSISGKQGGAMETILKRWVERIKVDIANRSGQSPEDISASEVLWEIRRITSEMSDMPLYSVFITMVGRYYADTGSNQQFPLMWLKGEYEQRTLAKKDLGVGTIIDDSNWFDFIKIWSEFVRYAGYKGLVLLIDEGVIIYKLYNSRSREKNYEKILAIYSDIKQNADTHMAVYLAATPDLIQNDVRGIKSYPALYSRIAQSTSVNGFYNPMGVMMNIKALSREDVVLLLSQLRDIHAQTFDYTPRVSDTMIGEYMDQCFKSNNLEESITPRNLSTKFLSLLDTMRLNPDVSFDSMISDVRVDPDIGHDFELFPPEKPNLEI